MDGKYEVKEMMFCLGTISLAGHCSCFFPTIFFWMESKLERLQNFLRFLMMVYKLPLPLSHFSHRVPSHPIPVSFF